MRRMADRLQLLRGGVEELERDVGVLRDQVTLLQDSFGGGGPFDRQGRTS
jgi:hypothetical protein